MTKKELHAIQIRNMAKARAALKRKRRGNNTLILNPTPPPADPPLVVLAKEFEAKAKLLWKAQELLRSPTMVISGVSMSTGTSPGIWGNK